MMYSVFTNSVGMKWSEADEDTKSIFRELAKENTERRQLAEFQQFKAAQARFFIKPPFLSETKQTRQVSADSFQEGSVSKVSKTEERNSLHFQEATDEFNVQKHPISEYNSTEDWAPLPINSRKEEMCLFEFGNMLSRFDWS